MEAFKKLLMKVVLLGSIGTFSKFERTFPKRFQKLFKKLYSERSQIRAQIKNL